MDITMDFSYASHNLTMGAKPNKAKQKNSAVPKDYKGMTKDNLRQELRKRGIKASGKKADMAIRSIH